MCDMRVLRDDVAGCRLSKGVAVWGEPGVILVTRQPQAWSGLPVDYRIVRLIGATA